MFYSIQHSINNKIVGKFFQSEDIAWNYGDINNPKLLSNIFFEKVDFDVIVPIPILHRKAKITDLISCVNATCSGQLIISEKLKNIIQKYSKSGLQFFKTSIVKDDMEVGGYFLMNMYQTNMEFINFGKSNVTVEIKKKITGTAYQDVKVSSLEEFNKEVDFFKKNMEIVNINTIVLNEDINEDFFMLKHSVKHVVSENLKKEIEDAGCTGIEFQPIQLSYNEWTAPGGEREKIYGKA